LPVAAAEAIFRQLDPAKNVTTLEFETLSGTLTAHRVGEQIMMELPAGTTVPASTNETAVVQNIFARALGTASVDINYIGYGGPGFSNYLLVEVNAAESLSEWRPDIDCFVRLCLSISILGLRFSRPS
jgi:predicted PhzF superfamily epimerase YddE/YHI9